MEIKQIRYDDVFLKKFLKLPAEIQKRAVKQQGVLMKNPFHPSLRLHRLKGKLKDYWSISLSRGYRLIFRPDGDGAIFLIDIGTHDIYE